MKRLALSLLAITSLGCSIREAEAPAAHRADPLNLGATFDVASTSTWLPSGEDQMLPQVVWDGAEFLAVWPDRRSGAGATAVRSPGAASSRRLRCSGCSVERIKPVWINS